MVKIISWNVAGIRAVMKKNFLEYVKDEKADIVCLQETKAHPDQVDSKLIQYDYHYWNTAEKKGYAGVAIFSKIKPLKVINGLDIPEHDKEGRVLTLEFDTYYLVNVYTPNSQRELLRLAYRQEWDKEFLKYLKKLETKKPVIVCGDFNVAHQEIDIARPKENRRNAGFTDEERAGFQKYIDHGFIDTFREFEKGPGHYTYWYYMFGARARNVGWRIDYFLISKALRKRLKAAFIREKVMGSDHCPVGIEIN